MKSIIFIFKTFLIKHYLKITQKNNIALTYSHMWPEV